METKIICNESGYVQEVYEDIVKYCSEHSGTDLKNTVTGALDEDYTHDSVVAMCKLENDRYLFDEVIRYYGLDSYEILLNGPCYCDYLCREYVYEYALNKLHRELETK